MPEQSPVSSKVPDRAQGVFFVPWTSYRETIITLVRLRARQSAAQTDRHIVLKES